MKITRFNNLTSRRFLKPFKLCAVLIVLLAAFSCGTTTKVTNSWASTDASSAQIQGKIAVLVKLEDRTLRRIFEDKLTQTLIEQGQDAISSYDHFTENDLNDSSALMSKIEQLGIGAALAVFPLSEEVKSTYAPTVSARVGIPVDLGFGPIFLGTSVPIAGGSYSETIASLEVLFYIKEKDEAIYSSTISGSSEDANYLVEEASKLIVDELIAKQIIK